MKLRFLALSLLFFSLSYSQEDGLGVIALNKKSYPEKIEADKIGKLPSYVKVYFDRDYKNHSPEEILLANEIDFIIDSILKKNLKVDLVFYSNIDLKNISNSLSYLTGGLEHGRFYEKTAFPRRATKVNSERYQISVSVRRFPYSNKRTFYYLFLFDTLKRKNLGYEQIIVDHSNIFDLNVTSHYVTMLLDNFNKIINKQ
ncbi:hypothetical protein AB9K26_03025 [Psychroserpens sp. XS_ASV72]|uniref:hypothetical protein n=1 Tax=Psychroserpens sp. XS_ASV72 TaxID=3241293 RepID=UPI0035121DC7